MDLKLLFLVLAIWVQGNSATVQDISHELESSSERLLNNVLRQRNIPKLPQSYTLKLQKVETGKGHAPRGRLRIERNHGKQRKKNYKNKSNKNKSKKKHILAKDEIIHKITPVKVILDVEVVNSKEKKDIQKIISNKGLRI